MCHLSFCNIKNRLFQFITLLQFKYISPQAKSNRLSLKEPFGTVGGSMIHVVYITDLPLKLIFHLIFYQYHTYSRSLKGAKVNNTWRVNTSLKVSFQSFYYFVTKEFFVKSYYLKNSLGTSGMILWETKNKRMQTASQSWQCILSAMHGFW